MAKGKYSEWLNDDKLILIQGWARDGLTNEQIAHNMGISRETLNQWRNKFVAISDALKSGKEIVDIEVENALLKRALGYKYNEITQEIDKNSGKTIKTKIVTKEVIPDITAQIFWLKNRKPDKWRDKPVDNTQIENETGLIEIAPVQDGEKHA